MLNLLISFSRQPHTAACADQDVERLRQELERYRQEQEQLRQTKARVLIMEERLRDLHWEDEVCSTVHSTRQPL